MAIGTPVLKGADSGTTGYPAVITVDEAISAGTTLILRMSLRDNGAGAATVVSVTDTAGNTWVRSVWAASASGVTECQLWRCSDSLALGIGDTVSIAVSGAAGTDTWAAELHAVTGLDLTSPLDTSASATATSSTPSSGNITTTNADDILLGAVAVSGATADGDPTQDADYLPTTGFFTESAEVGGVTRQIVRGHRIVSATETNAYAPTLAASRAWVALVGAFKAADGPATGSGTLDAQASDVAGTATSSSSGSGTPDAQASTLDGAATSGSTAAGGLDAEGSAVAGAASGGSSGSGNADAGLCTVIGIAVVSGDEVSGSGSLDGDAATVAGQAVSSSSASGSPDADASTVAGSATVYWLAAGSPGAQEATADGQASSGSSADGDLFPGECVVVGIAISSSTASGALVSLAAIVVGSEAEIVAVVRALMGGLLVRVGRMMGGR